MQAREAVADARAPVEVGARIHALDALRGIALLGILIANVRQMFLPWDIADFPVRLGVSERLAWLDWQLYDALVDLKFLTLFSLLFGIGFALQAERLTARGGGFAGIYLRRVAILAMFGIAHALLLYPAEVLMPYAVTALLLLAARKFSAHVLFRTGLVLLGTTVIWSYQLGALGHGHVVITVIAVAMLALAMIVSRRSGWRAALGLWAAIVLAAGGALTIRSYADHAIEQGAAVEYHEAQQQLASMSTGDPSAWPEEYRVRRQGSFVALVRLHARQYADILLYFAILLLWRTLGLFMVGAAAFRSGLLTTASQTVWARVATVGLSIGLPLSFLATWLQTRAMGGDGDWLWPEFLHEFSALPLAIGIAGTVFVLHARSARRWVWNGIEAAGRMALSNYIGQSLVMAALAEPWGLGLYGQLGGPMLTVLALVVFFVLALGSHAWLSYFRMGPLEWFWRCGTYWRWLPIR